MDFVPVKIEVGAPPRGGGTQTDRIFYAKSSRGSFAWGSAPGSATLVYVGAAPVTRGAQVVLRLGKHLFAGICKSDTVEKGSQSGQERTLQFVDFREYLAWDNVFCAFNKPDVRLVNGQRRKRYWHILPVNYDAGIRTFTDAPLFGHQILSYVLGARVPALAGGFDGGTVGSPWVSNLTGDGEFPAGVLNAPIYDFDCLEGRRLDAALNEICERMGTVFSLVSTEQLLYRLVFTRKGYGSIGFPTNSDQRRLGESLSGNATNVRILGDRNRYQVMDLEMSPDWARAWEIFLTVEEFAEDLFKRGTNVLTGKRFNAYADDPEFYRGRQDAMALAKSITVREYVVLRNTVALAGEPANDGNRFADFRLFSGRSRMDMPAALYVQMLLLRAFRPVASFVVNRAGKSIPLESVQFLSEQLCKVTYDPKSGAMTAHLNEPGDGNGLALVKGYQVGEDLFRLVQSDQLDASIFSAANSVWSAVPFQLDDSGEGGQFIIFDAPVFVSDDLFVSVNGQSVFNAKWSVKIPPVKCALVLAAERYSSWWGTWPNASRDVVENVQGLRSEFVLQNGVYRELAYDDGKFAQQKAQELANWLLLKQFIYFEGGYKLVWDPEQPASDFGQLLGSLVDRVEFISSGTTGTYEVVDFTSERQRDNFEPERELERRTMLASLFPGQAQLRQEADAHRKTSAVFKQLSPHLLDAFNRLVTGQLKHHGQLNQAWFAGAPSAALLAGTPIRKASTTISSPNRGTIATYPGSVTAADNVFVGLTVRQDESSLKPFMVATQGVVPARVLGPIAANDPVGLTSEASDWLVKGGSPTVGKALQVIAEADIPGADKVRLILVQLGGAGGGGGVRYRGDYGNESYFVGDIVRVKSATPGSTPGLFICVKDAPFSGDDVAPIYPEPEPPKVVYWHLWNLGPVVMRSGVGPSKQIYVNASEPF